MKNILEFLKDLAANNHRDWMDENRKRYLGVKQEFESIVEALIQGIGQFDPEVTGLKPKDCMFRINRDIRFSKDKSPYKTNFGAAITPGGKKSPNPTYYVHIQPGGCFVAGGIYMPQADALAKIRQEIDYNAAELKKVVEAEAFTQVWGAITGDELKTAPKGYPKDHPNIDLIRKKSFVVMKNLKDQEVLKEAFVSQTLEDFKTLHPFNQYLSVAIS